ncbi:RVT_2 domain-containing protein, partial [Cephalotus follicularis]
ISKPPDRLSLLITSPSIVPIPRSYNQAMLHDCWIKAIQVELETLDENHTWDSVPRPSGVKPIRCSWVFTTKLKPDGTLDHYKARLVTLGNRQQYWIDYGETFALVAKMTTVHGGICSVSTTFCLLELKGLPYLVHETAHEANQTLSTLVQEGSSWF